MAKKKVLATIHINKEDVPKERLTWNGFRPATVTFESKKNSKRSIQKANTRKEISRYV